jgi:hypothetical protein
MQPHMSRRSVTPYHIPSRTEASIWPVTPVLRKTQSTPTLCNPRLILVLVLFHGVLRVQSAAVGAARQTLWRCDPNFASILSGHASLLNMVPANRSTPARHPPVSFSPSTSDCPDSPETPVLPCPGPPTTSPHSVTRPHQCRDLRPSGAMHVFSKSRPWAISFP